MQVIKAVTDEQLQDAFNVRTTVFVNEQKVPAELEIDDLEKEATHFVLYDGEHPVGAGRFRQVDHFGKVERICVLREYRKHGAGMSLMRAIEDYAKDFDLGSLKLNAQISAIPFYEKLGYTVVSDEFMDAGIPHKAMEKQTQ